MPITSRADIIDRLAKGQGRLDHMQGVAAGTRTAGDANSGSLTATLGLNAIGTTLWATRKGFANNDEAQGPMRVVNFQGVNTRLSTTCLARLYLLGTIDLTSTVGNRFTPDPATFPVLSTRMGVASQRTPLVPLALVTTATTVAAAVFTFNYNNEGGTARVGNKTFTMPAAATLVGSGFILPVNEGDIAVTNVTSVTATTAATAGILTVFGADILAVAQTTVAGVTPQFRNLAIDPVLTNASEYPATAGTVSSILATIILGPSATATQFAEVLLVHDIA